MVSSNHATRSIIETMRVQVIASRRAERQKRLDEEADDLKRVLVYVAPQWHVVGHVELNGRADTSMCLSRRRAMRFA